MVQKTEPIAKPLSDLIEIIHFTENVSAKIHGILDKEKIYQAITEEFKKSGKYIGSISLLTEDHKAFELKALTVSHEKLKVIERVSGMKVKENKIGIEKSSFYNHVIKEKKTIQANANDIINELFPRPLCYVISKILRIGNQQSILTPLELHGKIVGTFTMTSTELGDYFAPSVKNLARHISSALEQADEYSERIKIEEKLSRERDLLQALMDNIPDAIYFKDAKSCFTRINKAQAATLGLKNPEEAVGKTDFDFFIPEHAQDAFNDEQEIIRTGRLLVSKVEKSIRSNGYFRWVSTSKVPIKDYTGQITGIVGISRDITELKNMEDDLRRYSDHLEDLVKERTKKLRETERLATIGETATMVGHDLGNPLQVISNQIYLGKKMIDQIPPDCKRAAEEKGINELFEAVAEQIEYMSKIVRDLSDYARPIKFEPVMIDARQLITQTLSSISIHNNIKITIHVEENLDSAKFMADPTILKRTLINLLTNAIQSMPNGGVLTVKAKHANETVSISVEDTGVGIPKENLNKLFSPLFTTKAKGVGLGLAVCQRLIEAHEGSITVKSEVGKGSSFTVQIPYRSVSQE
jgi:PAS domain S-box-containing protein